MGGMNERASRASWPKRFPIYYGWVNVVVAALAMSATLPGRSHGLGLITKPLLLDLKLDETLYAQLNLWSTLLGAAMCVPVGWLIDRFGARAMVALVTLALAATTLGMSAATGAVSLFAALVLSRGFGQSALSVVSLALVGKWFPRRAGPAMGVFSVLLTCGFIGGVVAVGLGAEALGWRAAWRWLGLALVAFAPLAWILARSSPEACGLQADRIGGARAEPVEPAAAGLLAISLSQAVRTPAFWVFVLGPSAFNLVWSGVMLFNESILAERGFDQRVSVEVMAILTGTGLISNLVGGALATRARIGVLLAGGLATLALALAAFPSITTLGQLRLYAVAMGLTGGVVTVVFFSVWGLAFGRQHLGRIQGAAQLATVLASAVGPVLMAECLARTGSYSLMFRLLAGAIAVLAVSAGLTPLPAGKLEPEPAGELEPRGASALGIVEE